MSAAKRNAVPFCIAHIACVYIYIKEILNSKPYTQFGITELVIQFGSPNAWESPGSGPSAQNTFFKTLVTIAGEQ